MPITSEKRNLLPLALPAIGDLQTPPSREASVYSLGYDEITLPPIGGNALYLLNLLTLTGIIKIEDVDYRRFAEVYNKEAASLTQNDLKEINRLFDRIEVCFEGTVRLLGNTFSGSGNNDYFTAQLLAFIEQKTSYLRIELILSFEDYEFVHLFISLMNSKKEELKNYCKRFVKTITCKKSLYNFIYLLTNDLISFDEIKESFTLAVLSKFKLFSYTRTDENLHVLFSPGKISHQGLKKLSESYSIVSETNTQDEFFNLIKKLEGEIQKKSIVTLLKLYQDELQKIQQIPQENLRLSPNFPLICLAIGLEDNLHLENNEAIPTQFIHSRPSPSILDSEYTSLTTQNMIMYSTPKDKNDLTSSSTESESDDEDELSRSLRDSPMQDKSITSILNIVSSSLSEKPPALIYPQHLIESASSAVGDLHGNAMKLIQFLILTNTITICESDYNRLYQLYQKPYIDFQKCDIEEMKSIIERITYLNKKPLFLIGDILSDRGNNDWFTLMILAALKRNQIPFYIPYSNHDIEFLLRYNNAYYHYEEVQVKYGTGVNLEELEQRVDFSEDTRPTKLIAEDYFQNVEINETFTHSTDSIAHFLEKYFITQQDIQTVMDEVYFPALTAIPYCVVDDTHLVLFLHAPAGLEYIEGLAQLHNIPCDFSSMSALIRTIDTINAAQKIRNIADLDRFLDRYENETRKGGSKVPTPHKHPLHYGAWNRLNTYISFNKIAKENYVVTVVHGHNGPQALPGFENHLVNLDSLHGKHPPSDHLRQEDFRLFRCPSVRTPSDSQAPSSQTASSSRVSTPLSRISSSLTLFSDSPARPSASGRAEATAPSLQAPSVTRLGIRNS